MMPLIKIENGRQIYFEGKKSLHEAIEGIKKNTRNYAKRQLTWFKKENTICGS